jgi:hypothetical protein
MSPTSDSIAEATTTLTRLNLAVAAPVVAPSAEPAQPDPDSRLAFRQTFLANFRDRFNDAEFRALCFELHSVDFETLEGVNKDDKARSLILYCERHERIIDLVAVCKKARPELDWDIARAADPSAVFGAGLDALIEAMAQPGVNAVVSGIRRDFELARERLSRIASLKRLHDAFNGLESQNNQLTRGLRAHNPIPAKLDAELKAQVQSLSIAVIGLHNELVEASFMGDAQVWADRLERASQDLQNALAAEDVEPLLDARDRLTRVMMLAPGYINAWFISVVDDLLRSELSARLKHVEEQLVKLQVASKPVEQFRDLVVATGEIRAELRDGTTEHDGWHSILEELHYVCQNMDAMSLGQVYDAWSDIRGTARELAGPGTDDSALALVRSDAALQGEIEAGIDRNETKASTRLRELIAHYIVDIEQRQKSAFQRLIQQADELEQIGDVLVTFLVKLEKVEEEVAGK